MTNGTINALNGNLAAWMRFAVILLTLGASVVWSNASMRKDVEQNRERIIRLEQRQAAQGQKIHQIDMKVSKALTILEQMDGRR